MGKKLAKSSTPQFLTRKFIKASVGNLLFDAWNFIHAIKLIHTCKSESQTQAAKDSKSRGKGLGYLARSDTKMNIRLMKDTDNFYKLVTEQKNIPKEILQFPGLRSSHFLRSTTVYPVGFCLSK